MVPQATQRMSQSIYWKPSFENVLSHEMVQSVGRLGRANFTPLDYFLWNYVKSMVYGNKPATINELRTNIEREIAAASANLCLKIVKNWVQRLDFCKSARGGHANEIEFHS